MQLALVHVMVCGRGPRTLPISGRPLRCPARSIRHRGAAAPGTRGARQAGQHAAVHKSGLRGAAAVVGSGGGGGRAVLLAAGGGGCLRDYRGRARCGKMIPYHRPSIVSGGTSQAEIN